MRISGVKILSLSDINGFFGLITDNMAVISFLVLILAGFQFPSEIIYTKIIPGTAFGVFIGDIILTYVGYRLCKKTGRNDITSMPLGLDLPSVIGIALTVIGPAFVAMKSDGMDPHTAAMNAWYIGMAGVVTIGILKMCATLCANKIQKIVPEAGLLGSLAGVCVGLIGYTAMIEIFSIPIIGIISFGLVIYTIIAKIPLPKRVPGIFAAIVITTILYHILGPLNLLGCEYSLPYTSLHIGIPVPSLDFLNGFAPGLKYFPIFIPFAILVIVGDINVTASAVSSGDPFEAKHVLFVDGLSTVIAGIFGSVGQTTAYIGQPAYKQMGSRLGYTLLAGIFIGLGGVLGYITFFVNLIPSAALAPVLMFVAMEIIGLGFHIPPRKHAAAVCLAIFPTVARLVTLTYTDISIVPVARLTNLVSQVGHSFSAVLVTITMGNGFILVGMLWGAFLAEIIDRKLKAASIYLLLMAVLSFFGIIHSVSPQGMIYLPWLLTGSSRLFAFNITIAYAILAIMFYGLSYTKSVKLCKLNIT